MICSKISKNNYRFEICKNGSNIFIKHPEMVILKNKRELKAYINDITNILKICED